MMTQKLCIDSNKGWTFDLLDDITKACEEVAVEELQLDYYPLSIEIINAEQMIDNYSSIGMPVMYPHWSFGKSFNRDFQRYQKGHMGLAYEIVINSDPCLCYCMEENSALMQTLVIAHAGFGHNAFFKNNRIFKETMPSSIIDYLVYAKNYILECERLYGEKEVESLLDACHSLRDHGVDLRKRRPEISLKEEVQRKKDRKEYELKNLSHLYKNITPKKDLAQEERDDRKFPKEPEENLLYFIEKNAPHLETWQREIVRIVRTIAQYFYPQTLTKTMNEGCACFTHYYILKRLHEKGILTDGAWIEFIHAHTSVIAQPDFESPYYSGINPYTLGFKMYMDVQRICKEPTDEDGEWFPEIAGRGNDWVSVFHDMMTNYRDDDAIFQFLSPKLMRDMKLFSLKNEEHEKHYEVMAIHADDHAHGGGYKDIRRILSSMYDRGLKIPNIQVTNVDVFTDNTITLQHSAINGVPLHEDDAQWVVENFCYLWQAPVALNTEYEGGTEVHEAIPDWL